MPPHPADREWKLACWLSLVGISHQLLFLLILPIPIACISWTVTHEEVFREIREWCSNNSKRCSRLYQRKFFYLFTCEYCFSHYVTAVFVAVTGYKLLLPDWRGYIIAGFSLVWIANFYISLYGRVRLDIKRERVEIAAQERSLPKHDDEDGYKAATGTDRELPRPNGMMQKVQR